MEEVWRLGQIAYNKRARGWLAGTGGDRFWAWEITIMFYEVVPAVDGYAEMRGIPAPKNHRERRAIVERHLPHLAYFYDELYGLSVRARYYNGHAMTESMWRKAAQCHEALTRSIPVQ